MVTAVRTPDPLGPIDYIVNVLGTLLILFVVVVSVSTALGSGSLLAFGHNQEVCVTAPVNSAVISGHSDAVHLTHVHQSISSRVSQVETCDLHPSTGLRVVASVPGGLTLLFVAGFLLLTKLIVRHARRRGLFTADVARRVTLLGAFLLGGSLAVSFLSAMADNAVLHHAFSARDWDWGLVNLRLSIPTLIAAFGILTFGRVMQLAVRMQRDIDTTI